MKERKARQHGTLVPGTHANGLMHGLLVVFVSCWFSSLFALSMNNLVFGKDDALFGAIERDQGDKPFGKFLDAGTGIHSLRWIATLGAKGMTDFTAITADATMQKNVKQEANQLSIEGNIIMGNWFSENNPLELHEKYDTILADYLIGAMDGFSPYQQDLMLPKLTALLKPGGRLYIVGLQPIPDKVNDPAANIICRVRQIRDACILLAGHKCYREYPIDWVHRQVQKIDSLLLVEASEFPILYKHSTIVRQINVARSKLPYFPSPQLAESMKSVLDQLEQESLEATQTLGSIKLGFDYVVSTEKKVGDE